MSTAKEVMKLRQMTGAGMLDCKKALAEANGDFDAAVDYLRKKGLKTAEKRADREANEGKVIALVADDGRKGAILEFNSETDFVAGTDDFRGFGSACTKVVLEKNPADAEALLNCDNPNHPGQALREELEVMTAKLGEKLQIKRYSTLEIPADTNGLVHSYIHLGDKHGVMIAVTCGKGETAQSDEFRQLVNDLALQVVAFQPVAVDRNGVDPTLIERELDVYREMARNEGKPEAIIDKIAQGKLNKFYSEVTLLEQGFVKEDKTQVQAHINQVAKALGDTIAVASFVNYVIGD